MGSKYFSLNDYQKTTDNNQKTKVDESNSGIKIIVTEQKKRQKL